MKGKIVVFWPYRHFGFLKDQSTLEEFFFHQDNVLPGCPTPEKDSLVEYVIGKRPDGRQHAVNVRVLPSTTGGAA